MKKRDLESDPRRLLPLSCCPTIQPTISFPDSLGRLRLDSYAAETAIAITAQVFIRAVSFYANASEMVSGAIIIALVCKTKKDASLQVVLAMIVGAQFILFSANLCELALNLLAVIVAS